MKTGKEHVYWRGFAGERKAEELLQFTRKNPGLKSLLSSMIDRCDTHVNKAGMRIAEGPGISQRLMRLRRLADGGFNNCLIHHTITRQLDFGIGITLAIPDSNSIPPTIKQLRISRYIQSVRLDLVLYDIPPFNLDPLLVYGKTGIHLFAAIGWTEINKWGNNVGEDLDGIRLFLTQEGGCFGSEIKFNGSHISVPQRVLSFNESHQPHIDVFKAGLDRLTFLQPKP